MLALYLLRGIPAHRREEGMTNDAAMHALADLCQAIGEPKPNEEIKAAYERAMAVLRDNVKAGGDDKWDNAEKMLRGGLDHRRAQPHDVARDTARLDWVLDNTPAADHIDMRPWDTDEDYLLACREGIDKAMLSTNSARED